MSISLQRNAPGITAPVHPRVAAREFSRMLMGALLTGLIVSVVTAGLTLLLAGRAEAAESGKSTFSVSPRAEPGDLLVGEGCSQDRVGASERDWVVKIDGANATIRVMQTFLLRHESDLTPIFEATLPHGARLQSLEVQSNARELRGDMVAAPRFDSLNIEAFEAATREAILVRLQDDGTFTTSPMPLRDGEFTLTVSYTYTQPIQRDRGAAGTESATLSIALQSANTNESGDAAAVVAGSVWIDWTGRQPRRLIQFPRDAALEPSSTHAGRVEALSWSNEYLHTGSKFHIAWAY